MKLYNVPRNTRIRLLDENLELNFKHIDGMYSYCINDEGNVVHIAAYSDVEIVNE